MFILEDQLETARVERDRVAGVELDLPVEVLTPDDGGFAPESESAVSRDEPESPGGSVPAGNADEPYQLAGVDEDGTAILYVGEATNPRSVRPRLPPDVGPPPVASGTPSRVPASSAPASSRRLPVPAASERLSVTERVGPTVQQQLRAASPPPPRPRVAPKRETSERPLVAAPDPKSRYQRLQALLSAGDHDAAIAGFRRFIAEYPQHDYADNAQYWLGEAYYDRRDYRTALVEFRKVVTVYPRGNKVPDALLKIGFCYLALGESDSARGVLQQVVAIYPKSRPAALAAARLEALGPEASP